MKKKTKTIVVAKKTKTKIGKTAWLLQREAEERKIQNNKDIENEYSN